MKLVAFVREVQLTHSKVGEGGQKFLNTGALCPLVLQTREWGRLRRQRRRWL